MAILRSSSSVDPDECHEGKHVTLRFPRLSDYPEWAALREESRDFLTPWEPTWPIDDLTRPAFRRRLKRYARDFREDLSYPFFVFTRVDEELVGSCIVSNVRRGVTQSCNLGYWAGEKFASQGYMSDAVRLLIPFVFDQLNLHRIEAACLPSNEPSKRLLKRVGFSEEGHARRFLKIDGDWRDHILFAMLADDPRPE